MGNMDSEKGERLKLKQIRSIFRLVGEIRELGSDPNQWRPHMVKRLRKIVKAQVVVSSEIHFRVKNGIMKVIDSGWICDDVNNVFQMHNERGKRKARNLLADRGEKRRQKRSRRIAGSRLAQAKSLRRQNVHPVAGPSAPTWAPSTSSAFTAPGVICPLRDPNTAWSGSSIWNWPDSGASTP